MDCKEGIKSEKDEFPTTNEDLLHDNFDFSDSKMKSEKETIEDPYVETFVKLEKSTISTKLETAIKAETIKCEIDSRTDNGLDTYPPDSYHFLLQKENDLCKDVKEVKEEKLFCFRDSMRLKTEDGLNLSNQDINMSSGQKNQCEKLFICIMCNKTFKKKSLISKHIKRHSGSRQYPCNVCNKTFKQKSNLIRHEKIHSGSRPFSCSVCNKSFTQKSHLIEHEKIHSGSRPFSCNVCNKSFTQKSTLIRHEIIHSGSS